MTTLAKVGRTRSIKGRVLLIALAPCLAVLLIGAGLSGYLIYEGRESLAWVDDRRVGLPDVEAYVAALQEERRLTMAALGGGADARSRLNEARKTADQRLAGLTEYARNMTEKHVPGLDGVLKLLRETQVALPKMRARLDSGDVPPLDGYAYYNGLLDLIGIGAKNYAKVITDGEVAYEQTSSADIFFFLDAVSRTHALAEYARFSKDPAALKLLPGQFAGYHQPPRPVLAGMSEQGLARFQALASSPEFAQLIAGDQALIAGEPVAAKEWQQAAESVTRTLFDLWISHVRLSANLTEAHGERELWWSLAAGIAVALVALLAALAAMRSSARLISRLAQLRDRTLRLADDELPALVAKAQAGEPVNPEVDLSWQDFGEDELGEVAEAFDKAQRTALSAAIGEAETRRGVRSVFLNIAHRSQVLVHRQLEELDQIERSEDNPDLLNRLFRLDHLATRTRRNAENLIILGGEQVGRRWRRPVALREVVRSAVSETEQYTRVGTLGLPEVWLDGAVVADVVHLLAELVDNGTSFSPPESRVEVRGNVAGRGVVVEVEDQGLGMAAEQIEQVNETLRHPPDFSVMSLAGQPRVGLFVVARLAAKHGVRVTLRESVYGGIRAIVLLPDAIVAGPDATPVPHPRPVPPEPTVEVVYERPARKIVDTTELSPDRPPLPQRVRSANLVPELAEPPQAAPEVPVQADAERSTAALAAFQEGTRRARAAQNGSGDKPMKVGKP